MSLRLLYLIFIRLCGWLVLLSRLDHPVAGAGGYLRGLSLVAVTVRGDVCWTGAGNPALPDTVGYQ